jgi:hypothetical protein
MIKYTLLIFTSTLLIFSACKHSIKPNALQGTWKYIKIEKPKSDDLSDTVSNADLINNAPVISFTAKNHLTIYWGGKVLSHGSYVIADDNINYTEQLADGKTRTFPFWVSHLDDKTIVFETLGKDGSRVTATKK